MFQPFVLIRRNVSDVKLLSHIFRIFSISKYQMTNILDPRVAVDTMAVCTYVRCQSTIMSTLATIPSAQRVWESLNCFS
jgi:hypothetical protein